MKESADKKLFRISPLVLILVVVLIVGAVFIGVNYMFNTSKSDSDLGGSLRSAGVFSTDGESSVDCHWCEEVLVEIEGSPDYCLDSGKVLCDNGVCVAHGGIPGFVVPVCNCDEACDTCTEKCEMVIDSSIDYVCQDTDKILCNDIGPCVDDSTDCDCDEENTTTGCDECVEECDEGDCVSSGKIICLSGACAYPEQCPENCIPACDLCTEVCDVILNACMYSNNKRCDDGRCIPYDERCDLASR